MSTTVKNALSAIKTRLEAIKTASGFNTDAGNQVYLGRRYFAETGASLPLLTIFSGDEQLGAGALNAFDATREIVVEGYIADASTPALSLEDLITDVQQALELPDITLGGLVDDLQYAGLEAPEPPDDGSDIATVQITYQISYQREYGT